MDALQFTYWLQGFAELSGDEPPTPAQWKSIRDHLELVFQKVTPPINPGVVKPNETGIEKMLEKIQKQPPMTPYPAQPYLWPVPAPGFGPLVTECQAGGIAAQATC